MDLHLHHRRFWIWLHWVAAAVAGAGTFASLVAAARRWILTSDATHSIDWLAVVGLCVVFEVVCVLLTCCIQQLILQSVGLKCSWLAANVAGMGVGACCVLSLR